MARLYANENFPLRVVHHLRGLGHDAITIQETGKGGQSVPDESVLEYAVAEERAVLTINRRHFIRFTQDATGDSLPPSRGLRPHPPPPQTLTMALEDVP